MVIVGDIKHSRVARSDAILFGMLGAKVTVCAPYSLLPCGIDGLGCDVETDFDKAIRGADIIVPLRVQKERMDGAYFSTQAEYHEYYGVTQKRLEALPPRLHSNAPRSAQPRVGDSGRRSRRKQKHDFGAGDQRCCRANGYAGLIG